MQTPTKRRYEMKRRLIAFVGIFCIPVLIVSGAYAQGKPDKPGNSQTEWIEFSGDLAGGEAVNGCCGNAGPFPPYHMTLNFKVGTHEAGTSIDGYLFINYFGAGKTQQYMVQFWTEDWNVGIKIIGGVIDFDRRTRVLTVTFKDEHCVDMITGQTITAVSFTLVRGPF
jgi:hypothetical protein